MGYPQGYVDSAYGGLYTLGMSKNNDYLITHGFTKNGQYPKEYNAWRNMRQRCNNPKHILYPYYGGRGIKITKDWDEFINFYNDMGKSPLKSELDRKEVNGDYSKENCRWVDKKTQQRNQRRTIYLTFNGETKRLTEWADELKMNPDRIRKRLYRGKSIERALSTKNHQHDARC